MFRKIKAKMQQKNTERFVTEYVEILIDGGVATRRHDILVECEYGGDHAHVRKFVEAITPEGDPNLFLSITSDWRGKEVRYTMLFAFDADNLNEGARAVNFVLPRKFAHIQADKVVIQMKKVWGRTRE